MNYLQLVQRANQEAGIGTNTPTTLAGTLIGLNAQMKTWVAQSWRDIQLLHNNWLWQYKTATLTTSQGTREYTKTSAGITGNLRRWVHDAFTFYPQAEGQAVEAPLPFLRFFDEWRPKYELGTELTTQNKIARFTITPDNKLRFNPVPDGAYVVNMPYWAGNADLAVDADIPALPEPYHEIIAYRAVMYYAADAEAWEKHRDAKATYSRLLSRLEREQLPPLELGGPLA